MLKLKLTRHSLDVAVRQQVKPIAEDTERHNHAKDSDSQREVSDTRETA